MDAADGRLLEPVGLSEAEERVYRALLRSPAVALTELTAATGLSRPQLRLQLAALESKGMLSRSTHGSARFIPVAPDVAVDALIRRRQNELEATRVQVAHLLADYHSSVDRGNPVHFVEVISGREAVASRFAQLQQIATKEMLIFDKPPYARRPINDLQLQRLKEGIRYRTIYSREALALPERLSAIRHYVQRGEEARVSSELPMKLALADRKLALMPLTLNAPAEVQSAVLVHPSSLLDAVATLFETFWARALPLPTAERLHERQPGSRGQEAPEDLLALLSGGLSDKVIAKQLGVSLRTVRRRIRRLMEELGAVTRFQAGLQAARYGTTDLSASPSSDRHDHPY